MITDEDYMQFVHAMNEARKEAMETGDGKAMFYKDGHHITITAARNEEDEYYDLPEVTYEFDMSDVHGNPIIRFPFCEYQRWPKGDYIQFSDSVPEGNCEADYYGSCISTVQLYGF